MRIHHILNRRDETMIEASIAQISAHACKLYQSRQMLCTEAVVSALNQGFNGGLTEDQTIAMSAPFCVALGESGCLCGALSGAIMACGLLIGDDRPYRRRKTLRRCARQLHDAFKRTNGATCCRVLTRKVKHDKKAHLRQCAALTAQAAEMAARQVLGKRPELISRAQVESSSQGQSFIGATWRRIVHLFS